jgi:hypothetical protein
MAVTKQVKQVVGQGATSTEHKSGAKTDTSEMIPLKNPPTTEHPAVVGVKMGYTKNLGNFESLRLDVSCTVPCDNTKAAMDAAFDFASEWCDDKMIKLQSDVPS